MALLFTRDLESLSKNNNTFSLKRKCSAFFCDTIWMKIKPSGNMSIRAFANNYKRNAKIYIYIYIGQKFLDWTGVLFLIFLWEKIKIPELNYMNSRMQPNKCVAVNESEKYYSIQFSFYFKEEGNTFEKQYFDWTINTSRYHTNTQPLVTSCGHSFYVKCYHSNNTTC